MFLPERRPGEGRGHECNPGQPVGKRDIEGDPYLPRPYLAMSGAGEIRDGDPDFVLAQEREGGPSTGTGGDGRRTLPSARTGRHRSNGDLAPDDIHREPHRHAGEL